MGDDSPVAAVTAPRLEMVGYVRHVSRGVPRWTLMAALWRPGERDPDALVADMDSPARAISLLALNAKLLLRLEAVRWN